MKKQKEKFITQIKVQNYKFSLRITAHAQQRVDERNIDEYVLAGEVLALGKNLIKLYKTQDEAIIIDKIKNISVVVGFKKNTIKIITVIDKSNVFVKSNTEIFKIA
jgi:hypothetical protein